MKRLAKMLLALTLLLMVGMSAAFAGTDPGEIVTSATGKFDTAVAVYIGAAVIGAAIMYIRKGLRGRG